MLATLPPPMHNDIKHHDYPYKPTPSRYSPPESPRHLPSVFDGYDRMNSSHRGLPPPAGLSLPPPERSSNVSSLGHLPAPPSQWNGADESMRHWLNAKAEEDRRKQEEEKTKQESLRLDQRRIEQSMLRESISGGIPPPMVPLIFAGMGGANLPGHTLEWAQQYLAQLSIQNQQQQQQLQAQQQQLQQQQQIQPQPHMSPDMRRESRMISTNPYGGAPPIQPAAPALNRTSAPQSSNLSRLNTGELVPTSTPQTRQPTHPLQQTQTAAEPNSGAGLFFHHWTPPSNNGRPPTPSSKSNHGSPFSTQQNSHLRSENVNSPKKRKAQGGHQANPPPTQHETSPLYSSRSSRERDISPGNRGRRNRSRAHSDASSRDYERGNNIPRPSSRQQRVDEMNGASKRHMSGSSEDHQRYDALKAEVR